MVMVSIKIGETTFKKGDNIFVEYIGNRSRRNSLIEPERTTYFRIDAIGKNDFYANGHMFDKKTLREKTKQCQSYRIWESEKHYLECIECCRLEQKIRDAFNNFSRKSFNISQLRKVVKTLGL